MMYLSKLDEGKRNQDIIQQARDGVKEALLDEDTGIVWRSSLFRRLQRLEKMLHIPIEEHSRCEGELKEPQKVFVKAVRALRRSNSVPMDTNGRPMNARGNGSDIEGGRLHSFFIPKKNTVKVKEQDVPKVERENVQEKARTPSWKGKSLWAGRDNEEVYVEIRALQHYEALGFKGFHAETRILTTIFSLLLWDIIFADVPGAFETPYQTAPLDLADDTFYHTRKDLIEARLEEIRNDRAREILERHDEQHRGKQTICIGLRWDICDRADLVEIIECLGGHTLALICRLFCEDYGGRSSGVPDLVVWNAVQGMCKFVEVKGPGDRPQENQKLWFDSLLRAGANVEICHVLDVNAPPKEKRKTPRASRKRKAQAVQEQYNGEDYRQADYNDLLNPSDDYVPPSVEFGNVPKKRRKKDAWGR
ncbi:hypothetical protein AX15_006403 [Amanita polypyramis BW_CC]|nr:hypothetical protein AX15_006403 [Amanita polypyramis BW_CC]